MAIFNIASSMRIVAMAAVCIVSPAAVYAQEAWSLDSCISYAISHNVNVKAAALNIASGEQSIIEGKDAFLPSLNGSASQSFSFGRGLTADNTYADRNTSNFQWGVNFSLPLFQGLSEYRNLDMAKANLQKLLYDNEAAKDDVTLNVISQYLQVLYAREVGESARSQLALSEYQVERQRTLLEAGKVAESELWAIEAQAAQDRLQVVTADNDTRTALVSLANLLQLPTAEGFDILPLDDAEPMIPSAMDVYQDALRTNNSMLAARQQIVVADKNVAVANCGYIPRLSFNAGVGSSYYKVNGFDNQSFGQQMRNNYSTYLGFSLSVPLFDGFNTRNSVRRAKIQKLNAELELERRESDLYRSIQLAYYQAEGARESFNTSTETLEKTELSFNATREKFDLGRATSDEFEQAKNNLFRTRVSRIQAHYEYLLRHRILMFYKDGRANK